MARIYVKDRHFHAGAAAKADMARIFNGGESHASPTHRTAAIHLVHAASPSTGEHLTKDIRRNASAVEFINVPVFQPVSGALAGSAPFNVISFPGQMVTGDGQNGGEVLMSRIVIVVLAVCVTLLALATMLPKFAMPLEPTVQQWPSISMAAKTRAMDLHLADTAARSQPVPLAPACQRSFAIRARGAL